MANICLLQDDITFECPLYDTEFSILAILGLLQHICPRFPCFSRHVKIGCVHAGPLPLSHYQKVPLLPWWLTLPSNILYHTPMNSTLCLVIYFPGMHSFIHYIIYYLYVFFYVFVKEHS